VFVTSGAKRVGTGSGSRIDYWDWIARCRVVRSGRWREEAAELAQGADVYY
jgi:hypothetical protein